MSDPIEVKFSNEEKTWAAFCHLSALIALLVPFAGIIGPLIVWLLKKDEMAFVMISGKEAINFQISILIYNLIAFALCLLFVGFFILIALQIYWLIFTIIATVKVSKGIDYKYPFAIRIIS